MNPQYENDSLAFRVFRINLINEKDRALINKG